MFKKWTIILSLLLVSSFALFWQSDSAYADFEDTLDIIDLFEANTEDATYGFMLKEVDGETLYGYKTEGLAGQFYPASTIKVAHHLEAARWSQNPNNSLWQQIPYYSGSCNNNTQQVAGQETIWDMMSNMMWNSSNNRTNALQDYFGQANINDTLHNVVGMSGLTQLNHKLGCDGPGSSPANTATLADYHLLYEGVANETLLTGTAKEAFENLMLNETNTTYFQWRINTESTQLGLTDDQKQQFLDHFEYVYKGGSYSWDVDDDDVTDLRYASIAGYIEIPALTCDGVEMQQYTFGAFIDEATQINGDPIWAAIDRMIETEISNGLETFSGNLICVSDWINIIPNIGYQPSVPVPSLPDAVLSAPERGLGDGVWLGTATFEPTSAPRGYMFAGQAFELVEVGTIAQLSAPMNLHISYEEMPLLNENSYRWFRFDSATGGWVDALDSCSTTSGYNRDTRNNKLDAPLCHTGQYALFGSTSTFIR